MFVRVSEALRSSDLKYLTSIFDVYCQKKISTTFLSVSELSLLLGKSLFKDQGASHYVPQHLKQANTVVATRLVFLKNFYLYRYV